jgi:homoserine kinase
MAVKTEFSEHEIMGILAEYDLGALLHSRPIGEGTVQTNYFLQTSKGRYVFRYYENRSRESVLFESELLAHLASHHFPCPTPVESLDGITVGEYNHKPVLISGWVEGRSIEKPTAGQWRQLIQKAAELPIITRDFHSRYVPYRLNYDPALCFTLAREEAQRLNSENATAKLAWLERELLQLELPPDLPQGICHGDFHFSNVLFRGEEFAALLDFDDANHTYLVFDLVGLIEYWSWRHPAIMIDLDGARRVVEAYIRTRPLSSIEQKHLFDVYKLSILFDCVWYFDRGAVDDFYERTKIEALSNLGRERFAEAIFSRAAKSSSIGDSS